MARLTTCLAILVVISLILQQQPVTGFPRPFRSFLKAQSRDLDESNDEDNDESGPQGLTCWVGKKHEAPRSRACNKAGVCDDCEPYTVIGHHFSCGIGCDNNGENCERCR